MTLWQSGQARRLKAGEYRFDREMTPLEVLDKIARGDVYLLSLTFREGLTIAEMAQVFETHGFGPAASFVSAASDASLVRDVDPAAKDLEGYLFPDTYSLPRGSDAARVVRAMVDRFQRVMTPELRQAAASRNFTVRQLVTLASIVEKETARPEERPLVAAVYANRLKIGMGLQCDPTVIYALQRAGRYTGNLRRDDLMFDSPYNTYRYPGPAARADRGARQGIARSSRRHPRTSTTCTSSAATTARTSSRARSTSTTATSSGGRCSTSGISGQGGRGSGERRSAIYNLQL